MKAEPIEAEVVEDNGQRQRSRVAKPVCREGSPSSSQPGRVKQAEQCLGGAEGGVLVESRRLNGNVLFCCHDLWILQLSKSFDVATKFCSEAREETDVIRSYAISKQEVDQSFIRFYMDMARGGFHQGTHGDLGLQATVRPQHIKWQ